MTLALARPTAAALPPVGNLLIARLPRAEQHRLLAVCETVDLLPAVVLHEPGEPMHHAHFPQAGSVSLLARLEGHPGLEVAMIGREGLLGLQVVLGVPELPVQALVLGTGCAWRVERGALAGVLARCPALHQVLDHYLAVRLSQLARAAACLRFHQIAPRLARWLLMRLDRTNLPQFPVTHECLATMLGVRRVGITVAASALRAKGLIDYHRGELRVLNRPGLESAACSCYAADCQAYARGMAG